ncbi:MAG: penicillin-binding protein 2 [Acidimicrobiales bacterium]
MNPDSPRLRLGVLGLIVISLFATLFSRLWYLQILASDQFREQARANSVREVLEPAPRGRILDRHGRVLVDNRVSVVVTVDRQKLPKVGKEERSQLLSKLATELTRSTGTIYSETKLEERLADVRYSPYTPVPVAVDVPKALQLFLEERRSEFADVVAVGQATIRNYPLGRTGSHVLGYVGSITDTEFQGVRDSPKTYQLDDQIGKTGVEQTYEADLRGTPGRRVLEVDAKGNTVRVISDDAAVPGDDLVLSIDADIQATTEQTLVDQLNVARGSRNSDGSFNQSPAGSAVVLDPNTGAVIAMASFPDFDPATFTKPIPTDLWNQLNDPGGPFGPYPLNNRALQGAYAPGSTFKLITAYAALQAGLITPETPYVDTGEFKIPGCTGDPNGCKRTNSGGTAHGTVSLPRALTVSSDTYFYNLGSEFWTGRSSYGNGIQKAAETFGFGAETGIPLTGEQAGWVPTPENQKKRHDANPTAFPTADWFTGDNVNLAIGQGDMLVTPLQLVNAYAAFANPQGALFSPNVATAVHRGTSQEVLRTISPRQLKTVPIAPDQRAAMLDGFIGVTQDASGTAYAPFQGFPGWTVAGKTGTAEVRNNEVSNNALFVGFGPAEAPQYVGAAVLENSGFGAVAAAPVIRRVFEGIADPSRQPHVGPGGVLDKPLPSVINVVTAVKD